MAATEKPIRLTWYIAGCSRCDARDLGECKVLGVEGYYCRQCAPLVASEYRRFRRREFSRMESEGRYVVPIPLMPAMTTTTT